MEDHADRTGSDEAWLLLGQGTRDSLRGEGAAVQCGRDGRRLGLGGAKQRREDKHLWFHCGLKPGLVTPVFQIKMRN